MSKKLLVLFFCIITGINSLYSEDVSLKAILVSEEDSKELYITTQKMGKNIKNVTIFFDGLSVPYGLSVSIIKGQKVTLPLYHLDISHLKVNSIAHFIAKDDKNNLICEYTVNIPSEGEVISFGNTKEASLLTAKMEGLSGTVTKMLKPTAERAELGPAEAARFVKETSEKVEGKGITAKWGDPQQTFNGGKLSFSMRTRRKKFSFVGVVFINPQGATEKEQVYGYSYAWGVYKHKKINADKWSVWPGTFIILGVRNPHINHVTFYPNK